MILSDKQIKELCIPPTFVVTHIEHTFAVASSVRVSEVESFSYDTEEVIKNGNDVIINVLDGAGIKSYRELTDEEKAKFKPMISPFVDHQVRVKKIEAIQFDEGSIEVPFIEEKIISYGTSSYGYDIRIADEFKIFTNINSTVINPKQFNNKTYVDFKGDCCIIPPNSFILARSLEYFKMPRDITGLVFNKSTYARCGTLCSTTVIEAGWEGHLVLEFANTTSLPAMLFANEGCAQIIFVKGDEECITSYADRGGKYQGQTGIQTPLV